MRVADVCASWEPYEAYVGRWSRLVDAVATFAAAAALARRGVPVVRADRKLGNDDDLSLLDGVDVVVKSGGVPNEAPLAAAALAHGVPLWSDAELAFRLLPNPFLAVTGTNGKT